MIEKKDDNDEEDEEEEEEDDSEEKKDINNKTNNTNNINNISKNNENKKSEIISNKKEKISIKTKTEGKTEQKSELNNTNNKKRINDNNNITKKISEKYTEKDIIENAGFKIEKSSKKSSNKSLSQIDPNNNNNVEKNPFESKITPDPPEVRNLRIHAAKIRNDFPKWSKIPEAKGGDLAIKCWNCENINICNSSLNVIQCPVCHEMNKVPKVMDRIDELLMLAKANTCVTYSDINHTVPLVNYIVVCPYCKCDNKVRETACFCICYMCKNKWTIRRPDSDDIIEEKKKKPPKQRNLEGNYYKYDSKTGRILPPDRPMRFSDLFFPDPMFYPGYYPINSLSPLYPEYFTPYDDYRYIDRQEKTIKYFDRINQQKKLLEKFGNILDDDKNINNNSNINNNKINVENNSRYEKPYYHLNYENNIEKRDILRQLEDLDRKSENLMKSRLFPSKDIKSSQNSILTIKSRYGNGETSSLYEKTKTSQKISGIKSDMKYSKLSKSNNNLSINNLTSKDKKGKESTSKSKSKSKSKNILSKSKRISMGELSGKHKSIEDTYFLKNNE